MYIVPLAMVVILSAGVPAETASLVEDLGSSRYARREAAGAALVKLGPAAVPALRVAAGSTDPEVRARSAEILRRIEAGSLTLPTMIGLDFEDIPLAEAIASVNAQARLNLVMVSADDPAWRESRVDCRSNGPVPFWTAIDLLCSAGRIRHDPAEVGRPGLGDAAFPLRLGAAVDPGLTSDSGPFRVQLASIHFQSDLPLTRNARPSGSRRAATVDAQARRQFYLQVIVAAEPRLKVAQDGPVRITQAVDDRGNSLLAPTGVSETLRSSGYLGVSSSPSLHLRVDLSRPDAKAEQIGVLRGEVPVVVTARKAGATAIPLGRAVGRSFRDDRGTCTVEAVRPATADRPCEIDLAIRNLPGSGEPTGDGGPFRAGPSPERIEILDERGGVLPWFPTRTSFDGEVSRTTIALAAPGSPRPDSIRFHEIHLARTAVPFEFRSIAMP
ncbi:hypothetical protein TA3x_000939 [Tundrisphaera sp. TA3]|uniref:hypothetical protein n=1 Tax=Tundrisphaera sp. TA3 TaxID=3435775 RepID=UPI003EB9C832